MAGGFFTRLMSSVSNARVPAKPYTEQGVAGFTASGGYIVTPEKNADVAGPNRWHTAQDLLTNISIIAASVRYSMNLISRPSWRADPPSDKPEAKAMAEFVEEVINGADTSWARIVRRSAVYRYHGFNLQEWVAKKRDDGKIGIDSIEQRPAHTIRKWDLDDNGGVLGVVQASPQTGQEVYLPRAKMVYLVDDALTDSPEGLGWFRHLADPAQRLKRYLKLETMGFERDLAGIPIGRAPLQRINQLVLDGKLTRKEADKMVKSLEDFVRIAAKQPETGLLLDSEPFRAKTETGETVSSVMQWGLELLTGSPGSMNELGSAIHRLMTDMAMIIGTESLMIGHSSGGSSGGSRALSEDKSKNLYLTSNAALSDMAEAFDRDIVTPLWVMNGFDDDLRPKLKTEDVSFKDAEGIANALAAMAQAGAILHPNDPAINDLRDLMGITPAPPVDETTADLMLGAKAGLRPEPANDQGGGGGATGGRPSRENPGNNAPPGGGSGKTNPKSGVGRAQKEYDPDEPRDDHGRWTDGGTVDLLPTADDREWFTGSKIIEDDGTPQIVHHWTYSDFENFDRNAILEQFPNRDREGVDRVGIWFTDNKQIRYANPEWGGKRIDAILAIKKPLYFDDEGGINAQDVAWRQLERSVKDAGGATKYREHLSAMGYDGVVLQGTKLDGHVQNAIIALEPSQIRRVRGGGDPPPNPKPRPGRAQKYDPDQPRDDDGKWTSSGSGWRSQADTLELQRSLHDEAHPFFKENPEAAAALRRYQRQGAGSSKVVNDYLRAGGEGDTKLDASVAMLDRAAMANDLSGVSIYRGTGRIGSMELPGDLEAARGLIGKEAAEPGYASASVGPSNFVGNGRQMLHVTGASQGALVMAARDSKAVTESIGRDPLPEGGEVMLPRGTRFRITGVHEGKHPTIPDHPLLVYEVEANPGVRKLFGRVWKYDPAQPRAPDGEWTDAGFDQQNTIPRPEGVKDSDIRRAFSAAFGAGLTEDELMSEHEVNVADLHSLQPGVMDRGLEHYRSNPEDLEDPINVVRIKGQLVIDDGNHRVMTAMASGRKTLPAVVSDLDKAKLLAAEATAEKAFNPDQPRAPAGSSDGGQWMGVSASRTPEEADAFVDALPDAAPDRQWFDGKHGPEIDRKDLGLEQAKILTGIDYDSKAAREVLIDPRKVGMFQPSATKSQVKEYARLTEDNPNHRIGVVAYVHRDGSTSVNLTSGTHRAMAAIARGVDKMPAQFEIQVQSPNWNGKSKRLVPTPANLVKYGFPADLVELRKG